MTLPPHPSDLYVLGIDAGGTKTVCLLATGDGTVVGEARGGGANLQAAGELEVEKVLHQVMEEVVAPRAVRPAAICLGMAGVDREDDATVVRAIMRRIGYQAHVTVTNDALVALVAGAGHDPGIVIISGTGSIAYGRNANGEAARAGGWGYVLGDEGSGYWIGRLALRAVVREADGRGRATSLTPRILEHFQVGRAQDLVHQIYYKGARPSAIANVARHVQSAYDEGDVVAGEILRTGARELVASAASVANRLDMREERFTFVLAGGMFRAIPWLAQAMSDQLPEVAPRSTLCVLDVEPAYGAVRIAMAAAAGESRVPAYKPHS